jgi:hypothetical protein
MKVERALAVMPGVASQFPKSRRTGMKKTVFCLFSLVFVLSVSAQTRRRTPTTSQPATTSQSAPSRAPRKLVETVRTQDGREIHLYDDMTYDVAPSVAPLAAATVDINIKAGVITKGGDVKPVARSEFMIFKDDIKPIIATVNDRDGKPLDVFGFYMADEYRLLDNGLAYTTALQKLKPIIVGTFTTDFEGNASIQVPRSDTSYYIYGSFKVGRSSCMWYLKFVPNKNGGLVLDNSNSAYCG